MTTITEPTTVRHNVGTCPACRAYLWAEVDIAVRVSPPTLDRDGKAHVFASPHFLGMRVEHNCERTQTDEWVRLDQDGRCPVSEFDHETGMYATCQRPAGHDGDHRDGQGWRWAQHLRQSPETTPERPDGASGVSVDPDEDGRAL